MIQQMLETSIGYTPIKNITFEKVKAQAYIYKGMCIRRL